MARLNILVVEDDPDIGALLDRGLGAAGFAVKWVDTAGGALEHMAAGAPHAVLLDVMHPAGTGHPRCGLSLDLDTRQARFRDALARLTQREADLLALFMGSPNKPTARGDIFDRLWLDQGGASLNVVDVYVGYLRSKLGDIVKVGGPTIATVRGRGFMLEFARQSQPPR